MKWILGAFACALAAFLLAAVITSTEKNSETPHGYVYPNTGMNIP